MVSTSVTNFDKLGIDIIETVGRKLFAGPVRSQQTGDFTRFTHQRCYGRQYAYSSCSEPKMGRLCVYHDHLAAQSILVNV